MESSFKRLFDELGRIVSSQFEISNNAEESIKILLDFVAKTEVVERLFHYIEIHRVINDILYPMVITLSSKQNQHEKSELLKKVLKIIYAYVKSINKIDFTNGVLSYNNKPLFPQQVFSMFSIIISTEIGSISIIPRNSEIVFNIIEHITLHTTPSVLSNIIQTNILNIVSIILSSDKLKNELRESALSLLISCCYLSFDSFVEPIGINKSHSSSKLALLLDQEKKRKHELDTKLNKRSVRFQVNSCKLGSSQPLLPVPNSQIAIGEKVYNSKTLKGVTSSLNYEVSKILLSIIEKNSKKITSILFKTNDSNLKERSFIIVGIILKLDKELKQIQYYDVQYANSILDSISFWYGNNDCRCLDYLTVRICLWVLYQLLCKIKTIIEMEMIRINETPTINGKMLYEDILNCGIFDTYQNVIQNFIPDKTPNDILTKTFYGIKKCFELNTLCGIEETRNSDFLQSLCFEKCCNTMTYFFSCLMVDEFTDINCVEITRLIFEKMREENEVPCFYRIETLELFLRVLNQKTKYEPNDEVTKLLRFIDSVIKKFNDDIIINNIILINLLFPSYTSLHSHLPFRKYSTKKFFKETSNPQSPINDNKTQVDENPQHETKLHKSNEINENKPIRRRKLVEVVDDDEDLDDIFGGNEKEEEEVIDLDTPIFKNSTTKDPIITEEKEEYQAKRKLDN
ncbi:hypothetical protein ENUP19_0130G0024 [Entamoeba nuttalli]|uniref:Uncharacterized protein n=2 Tax=Entamoeba nuttalli TaxID=412467 RepID=K2HBH2_ENTNP|nr:hypothetical protein ENU1_105510 [Entamoeba nuttalli P19]EKE40014.1 hypothetical protein ENU1_105510 [Entamoeba nuttalli P19]|eukprot:XP_008857650.1 hypothetical protein ENU1_105510 [Entamoeba nuttalli P19]